MLGMYDNGLWESLILMRIKRWAKSISNIKEIEKIGTMSMS